MLMGLGSVSAGGHLALLEPTGRAVAASQSSSCCVPALSPIGTISRSFPPLWRPSRPPREPWCGSYGARSGAAPALVSPRPATRMFAVLTA